MGTLSVHKSLMSPKEQGPEKASIVRCPHCDKHFFADGGMVSPEKMAKEFDYEHGQEMEQADRVREYEREHERHYGQTRGEAHLGFADGGRVDGAGKVDGIHTHPSECEHLAGGGVCRHLPPNRHEGAKGQDRHIRNFAKGGGVESFSGYLAKRHAARKGRAQEFKGRWEP